MLQVFDRLDTELFPHGADGLWAKTGDFEDFEEGLRNFGSEFVFFVDLPGGVEFDDLPGHFRTDARYGGEFLQIVNDGFEFTGVGLERADRASVGVDAERVFAEEFEHGGNAGESMCGFRFEGHGGGYRGAWVVAAVPWVVFGGSHRSGI